MQFRAFFHRQSLSAHQKMLTRIKKRGLIGGWDRRVRVKLTLDYAISKNPASAFVISSLAYGRALSKRHVPHQS